MRCRDPDAAELVCVRAPIGRILARQPGLYDMWGVSIKRASCLPESAHELKAHH